MTTAAEAQDFHTESRHCQTHSGVPAAYFSRTLHSRYWPLCSRPLTSTLMSSSPVMQGLTRLQNSDPNTPQYWFLWGLIADAVKRAKWLAGMDTARHPDGTGLLSAVFLTLWKDNGRHWPYLDGYAHLVHALFEGLPTTSVVFDNYTGFLYHIGKRSLPDAFVRVGDALSHGNTQDMLARSNTVFMLEVLLQRYVYGATARTQARQPDPGRRALHPRQPRRGRIVCRFSDARRLRHAGWNSRHRCELPGID